MGIKKWVNPRYPTLNQTISPQDIPTLPPHYRHPRYLSHTATLSSNFGLNKYQKWVNPRYAKPDNIPTLPHATPTLPPRYLSHTATLSSLFHHAFLALPPRYSELTLGWISGLLDAVRYEIYLWRVHYKEWKLRLGNQMMIVSRWWRMSCTKTYCSLDKCYLNKLKKFQYI